jgi:ABC-type uncharacterized transport system substrate-binding protein
MWYTLKHLTLGILLIAGAAAVLLVSDWGKRSPRTRGVRSIAILQICTNPVMDASYAGALDALSERGFVEGENLRVSRQNPEHDMPTANQIAATVLESDHDLVITVSTLMLQTFANANRNGKVPHIFCTVTDPFGAGVGISAEDPLDHPEWLAGIGTFQPVANTFRLAREMLPQLARVGVVWNSSEACSLACIQKARGICDELGIELLEVTVESPVDMGDALRSVIDRGAEALWVGGDSLVETNITQVLKAAENARIPVFCHSPSTVDQGVFFALGADYYEVGRMAGELAADVLEGKSPAEIPIVDRTPERLAVNATVLQNLDQPWQVPDSVRERVDIWIDGSGKTERSPRRLAAEVDLKRVAVVYFGPDPATMKGIDGYRDALRDQGFVEGRNLELKLFHAQGEIANVTPLLQRVQAEGFDLISPMTTPCLTAACAAIDDQPMVFCQVYDPIAAGAGTSFTDHLPNLTGIGSAPPIAESMEALRQLGPAVRTVGTVYNPAEANSRGAVELAREILAAMEIQLQEVTVASAGEVLEAVRAVTSRDIQALWVTGDNTVLQAFGPVVRGADEAGIPLLINDPELLADGALLACGFSFYRAGYAGGEVAARVLRGESPARIPIRNVTELRLGVNLAKAAERYARLPAELLGRAVLFPGLAAARGGRPAGLCIVAPDTDQAWPENATAILSVALHEAGMVPGTDVIVSRVPDPESIPAGTNLVVVTAASGLAELSGHAHTAKVILAAPHEARPAHARDLAFAQIRASSVAQLPLAPEQLEVWIGAVALTGARLLAGLETSAGSRTVELPRARTRTVSLGPRRLWRLAGLDYVETPIVEAHYEGFFAELRSLGLQEGRDFVLTRRCAQGDMSQMPAMVDSALSAGADLLLVTSTPLLQTAIHRAGTAPVLFGVVADPCSAGAGTSDREHLANVTGVYSMSDFEKAFQIVRQCLPQAGRIGTLYCPAEANSETYREHFETHSLRHGFEPICVASATASEISDSASALVGRGVDAVLQISDNLHGAGFPAVAKACLTGRVPLFSFVTRDLEHGAALTVARDFEQGGRDLARVLKQVMDGTSTADIPFTPISRTLVKWDDDNAKRFGLEIPESVRRQYAAATGGKPPGAGLALKAWRLRVVRLNDAAPAVAATRGILDGLVGAGLRDGEDYVSTVNSAQGDMSLVPTLLQTLDSRGVDLVITLSTPVLQSALQVFDETPILFTYATSGVLAGAGTSETDHLPHVTGITTFSPFPQMREMILACFPDIRRVGTLVNPAEINSVAYRDAFREELARHNVELVDIAVSAVTELPAAAQALCLRGVDLICPLADNLSMGAFPSIAQAAGREGIPLFAFASSLTEQGAAVAVASDFYEAGRETGWTAARIVRGESPADIPFRNASQVKITINEERCRALGISPPRTLSGTAAGPDPELTQP